MISPPHARDRTMTRHRQSHAPGGNAAASVLWQAFWRQAFWQYPHWPCQRQPSQQRPTRKRLSRQQQIPRPASPPAASQSGQRRHRRPSITSVMTERRLWRVSRMQNLPCSILAPIVMNCASPSRRRARGIRVGRSRSGPIREQPVSRAATKPRNAVRRLLTQNQPSPPRQRRQPRRQQRLANERLTSGLGARICGPCLPCAWQLWALPAIGDDTRRRRRNSTHSSFRASLWRFKPPGLYSCLPMIQGNAYASTPSGSYTPARRFVTTPC